MAKCAVTGKKPQFGNNVPFSKKKSRRQFKPNVSKRRIFVPELGRFVRIYVSVEGLRIIDKVGLVEYLKRDGRRVEDII